MRPGILLESFQLTAQQQQQILNNPHVMVGYETEMVLPLTNYSKNKRQAEAELNTQLVSVIGSSFPKWQLVDDLSIKPDADNPGLGFELVSPAMPIQQALATLKRLFEFMNKQGIYTNITTGFHVGVSVPEGMRDINRLKLLMLLDEQFVADAFDRSLNTYTQSHVDLLRKQIAKAQSQGRDWVQSRKIQQLINSLQSRIDVQKYRTVNFSKLKQGYLEFRIMGNQDYHKNYSVVRYFILRYAAVVLAALDPTAFEKEYQQQVARMVADALQKANPEFPDLVSKYAVLGAGKNTDRHQNYLERIHAALEQHNSRAAVVLMSMLISNADKHADETTNATLINAAALSYRIFLKRHMHMNIAQFRAAMQLHKVKPDVIARVVHYLKTY